MIDTPKGIDLPIQEMQQLFVDNLWLDIDISKKSFNHRVFKNKDRNGNDIPQIYKGNREYQNVSFNDRVDVLSWFDVADTTDDVEGTRITQSVGVFFAVNLAKLYPDLSHRAIEESHLDVQNVLFKKRQVFKITGITTGAAAYGDFSTENLKGYNMQPWHVFRFDCNVSFTLKC